MKQLFNKYDLGWFIVLFLVISITLISMTFAHSSYKLVSHVFFGLTIVGFFGLLFAWISRKKDNSTFKKGEKKFTESDKRIIKYYIGSDKYDMESFKEAKSRQVFRFVTVILLPTFSCFLIALIYALL